MKMASKRALDDLDIAAELRAHGATWETIARVLGRHKRVLMRWVRYYSADWQRLSEAAEQRAARRAATELPRAT